MKIRQATKKGWVEWNPGQLADLSYPKSKLRRARVQEGGKVSPALQAGDRELCYFESEDKNMKTYRIRKLTPRECWRLMDFTDEQFDKAEKVNSATQLYKQAGNSIVVNVLTAVFGQMIKGKEDFYKNYSNVCQKDISDDTNS